MLKLINFVLWMAASTLAFEFQPIAQILEHNMPVLFAIFSPDESKIVTFCFDGSVQIWGAQRGELLSTFTRNSTNASLPRFSPDSTTIIRSSSINTAVVWDAHENLITTLEGHTNRISSTIFSPDGTKILTGSWDGSAKIWDAKSFQLLNTLTGHTSVVQSANFSPDGTKIVTGSWDHTAKIWDTQSGQLITTLKAHTNKIYSASFSQDSAKIITSSLDNTVNIWDAESGQLLNTFAEPIDSLSLAIFSLDGTKVITSSRNNSSVNIWNTQDNQLLSTLGGSISADSLIAFSPDGTKITTSSYKGTADIWDIQSGELLITLKNNKPVYSASFNSSGTKIVTSSENNAKIWLLPPDELLNPTSLKMKIYVNLIKEFMQQEQNTNKNYEAFIDFLELKYGKGKGLARSSESTIFETLGPHTQIYLHALIEGRLEQLN